MINLRYHFITIASIFLALAIGILLGGTAGQSWFTEKEQEIITNMEQKYNKALKSNNELKQQVNQLILQVEKSNEEVIHLMATRYQEDLQGEILYLWHGDAIDSKNYLHILESVGVKVKPYQPHTISKEERAGPLLILGRELPEWIHQLPASCKWLQVETLPNSPAKQWKLLESVETLLKEKRWENEKS